MHDLGIGNDDLGFSDEDIDDAGIDIRDSGMIYGVYGGVDFDISSNAVLGIEGNFNLGTSAIDSDNGVAARVGNRTKGGSILFVRGGYQVVDIDVRNVIRFDDEELNDSVDDTDFGDVDDTYDDFLFGIGADLAVGKSARIRLAVDTLGLDTIRPLPV